MFIDLPGFVLIITALFVIILGFAYSKRGIVWSSNYKEAKRQRLAIKNDQNIFKEIMIMIGKDTLPKQGTKEYEELHMRCVASDEEYFECIGGNFLSLALFLETATDKNRVGGFMFDDERK